MNGKGDMLLFQQETGVDRPIHAAERQKAAYPHLHFCDHGHGTTDPRFRPTLALKPMLATLPGPRRLSMIFDRAEPRTDPSR